MKKIFLFAALLLTVGSSWAFHAKAVEPVSSYMMVISRFTGFGFSAKGTLSTISAEGQVQTQEISAKTGSATRVAESFDQLHLSELKTLNDLRASGWQVKTATQVSVSNGAISETDYLLEKQ